MKFVRITILAASLLTVSASALGAYAIDGPAATDVNVTSEPATVTHKSGYGVEITASPTISKAEVKRLEREKEKRYKSHDSFSERAFTVTRGTLSY